MDYWFGKIKLVRTDAQEEPLTKGERGELEVWSTGIKKEPANQILIVNFEIIKLSPRYGIEYDSRGIPRKVVYADVLRKG